MVEVGQVGQGVVKGEWWVELEFLAEGRPEEVGGPNCDL